MQHSLSLRRSSAHFRNWLLGLCCSALMTLPALAQTVAPTDAKTLATYDKNGNGKLDPDEMAAMQAEQAKVAKTPAGAPAAESPDQTVVELSPFEVTERNNGYYAGNSISGTRLNTKLEDVGASISVVTKQQMQDFAMLDINDVFLYEAGTEGTGTYTAFEVDRNGMITDQVQNNPQGSNRVRGIGSANISLDSFATSGRVPLDPSGVDAVEISRGPNSSIFGLGEGSGTVNVVASSANFSRESTTVETRFDDRGGWRASLDVNRPLLKGKVGVRAIGVNQHTGYNLKPSGFDERRFNFMVRAQPFKSTTVRASFQSYRGFGTRPNSMTPRDAVSYWKGLGSPSWDPIANAVTVGGVTTVLTGTANPTGLAGQGFLDPVLFVDGGGLQLWEIGRMPTATATNGPNNTGGTSRLLETVVEPIRTNHPLFSTAPGLNNKSIYDWGDVNLAAPNTIREKNENTTVQVEQYLLNTERQRLAIQFAWQREDAERVNRNVVGSASATGSSFYLYVDPNTKLLDGRTNPYFGKTYLGVGEPVSSSNPYIRDSYRGQAAYILDFTDSEKWYKWIGRHQLVGYYEERKTKTFNYRFRDAMVSPDNPIYAPAGTTKGNQATTNGFGPSPGATRTYFHFYTGDGVGANVDYGPSGYAPGNYTFNWYNPLANGGTGAWVADNVVLGTAGITEGTAGNSGVLNLIKTKGGTVQSSFLKDRIVTTFGQREDENRNKFQRPPVLKSNGWEFDYAAMDGWLGDWAFRSGKTKTSGVVVKPFRGWSFIENKRSSGGFVTRFVSELLTGATGFYNKSNSFRPESPAISITLEDLPNPTSEGKDYGFTLNLGSKFNLRFNRYQTSQINSRSGQSAIFAQRTLRMDFAPFAGNNDALSLQRQSRNWLTAAGLTGQALSDGIVGVLKIGPEALARFNTETITETSDAISKGTEVELNYNPDSFLTVRGSVTRTSAIDLNLSPHIPAWIAQRMPIWEAIVDPRTGVKWLDQGYSGDNPSTTAQTPRQFLQSAVFSPLAIAQAAEGKRKPQNREWSARMTASYRLAGLFENQYLKRVSVTGAVRWESKGAIGYYGVPINGDILIATQLDKNRPIFDSDHAYYDAGISYSTRVYNDKWRVRFQLNARNLQESGRLQTVGAYPDGRGNAFRIVDPRTFIFTTSLDL